MTYDDDDDDDDEHDEAVLQLKLGLVSYEVY